MKPTVDIHTEGHAAVDTGLHCLTAIARFHRLPAELEQLKHQFGRGEAPLSSQDILRAAKALGFRARQTTSTPDRLHNQTLPAIGSDHSGNYFIIAKVAEAGEEGRFLIQRMDRQTPETLDRHGLSELWTGELIRLALRGGQGQEHQFFHLGWFIPALVKYRKHFSEVLTASFFLQLFALATPLYFQVVMDKVLVHQGFTTLDVLAFGFLVEPIIHG